MVRGIRAGTRTPARRFRTGIPDFEEARKTWRRGGHGVGRMCARLGYSAPADDPPHNPPRSSLAGISLLLVAWPTATPRALRGHVADQRPRVLFGRAATADSARDTDPEVSFAHRQVRPARRETGGANSRPSSQRHRKPSKKHASTWGHPRERSSPRQRHREGAKAAVAIPGRRRDWFAVLFVALAASSLCASRPSYRAWRPAVAALRGSARPPPRARFATPGGRARPSRRPPLLQPRRTPARAIASIRRG
jgi:hypothetical protein